MTDIHQIKRLSIRDYLSCRGIRPARENDRHGFYLSPLRTEHTPSFKVDYTLNLWYDFGTDKGGSIIDLVMGLENCDKAQAIRLLDSGEISPATLAPALATPTVPALRILAHTPLQHAALIGYLRERGIDPTIAAAYCRQVRYAVGGREFFAIGFGNDAGGWELRSEHFKGGSSPKHITTLDNHADTCIAFEGFMDFLSYLTLKKAEQLRIDAVVLNSVVNIGKAIPFMQRHRAVHTFFDNDDAGRRATNQVQQLAPAVEVVDQAPLYRDHNDLNNYLKAHRKQEKQQVKAIKKSHDQGLGL